MMVSFKTLLLPLAAMVALAQAHAGGHAHHRRLRYQARHYANGTETTIMSVSSVPLGTGIETTELPAVTSSVVGPEFVPIFTPPPVEPAPVTTACITKYETKTYTYTLGNGKAKTTTIIHTNFITQTVTPVPEPTKESSVGEDTPGANAEEDSEFSSTYTSTSTTTVLVTITRTLPLPKETNPPISVDGTPEAPCHVNTVYITAPVSVSVSVILETVVQTVKETVKETITVIQTPTSEQAPVYTPPPSHPPYSNHTATETVRRVTLTVVPIPYQ